MINAILLSPEAPTVLLEFLGEYVRDVGARKHLFAQSVDWVGGFVVLDIVKDSKGKDLWKVQIPVQFVLAIAPIRQDAKNPIGFV